MVSSNEAIDKVAFFDELYALGQTSEDEGNMDGIQHLTANQIAQDASQTFVEVSTATQRSDDGSKPHSVRRTASQPTPISDDATLVLTDKTAPLLQLTSTTASSTGEGSRREARHSIKQNLYQRRTPHRIVSAPTACTAASLDGMDRSLLGKRKRKGPDLKFVPEAQRMFSGYNFFFIPNDDVAPLRRARIRKAQEYGAVRYTEWHNEITHIVVDKMLSYGDVISFLKIPTIPKTIIMTNDTYPIDCVQFKAILDPKQRQYRVKGHEHALEEEAAQNLLLQSSSTALQLKKAQSRSRERGHSHPQATSPQKEAFAHAFPSSRLSMLLPSDRPANTGIGTSSIEMTGFVGEFKSDSIEQPSTLPTPIHASLGTEGGDLLDEMIREARLLKHLPLDKEDFDQVPSRDETPEKDEKADRNISTTLPKSPTVVKKGWGKATFDQKSFTCMKGGNGITDTSNPNSRTISILQEMADYYMRINDTWRPMAYRKAISTLRQQSSKITTSEEAFALPCVGQRLALKIEEIVTTDRLRRLENAETEPTDQILQIFMGIYGAGFSQASKWLHSGYSTLEDLKKQAHLTKNQLLMIEHYEDFRTRIPREEVTALGDIVKSTAHAIDPEIEIIIGGSYRRGAPTSGDIDCIVTKLHTSNSKEIFFLFAELISRLTSSNFLVAALAVPRTESGTKWHGCCVLGRTEKPIWRRIDFLLVPASELGAALIYFTGNDIFNRSIRLLASRKGMRLNQRGLYKDVMRGPQRVKLTDGELVEGADEEKIFAVLGVPWRPPEHRIC